MNKLMIITFLLALFNQGVLSYDDHLAISLDGTSSHIDGPNCWNGALYVSRVIDAKKFTSPEEWSTILNQYCSKVDSPQFGDVGRIRDSLGVEVHGYIYLSDDEVFAKHGHAVKDGYKKMPFADMLNQYERTRNCRMNEDYSDHCFHKISYYRCQRKAEVNHHVSEVAKLFEELIFSKESKIHYKDNCSSQSFLLREEILNEILVELHRLEKIKHFMNKLDKLFLDSFITQLGNIEVSNRRFRCADRKMKKATIKKVKDLIKSILQDRVY